METKIREKIFKYEKANIGCHGFHSYFPFDEPKNIEKNWKRIQQNSDEDTCWNAFKGSIPLERDITHTNTRTNAAGVKLQSPIDPMVTKTHCSTINPFLLDIYSWLSARTHTQKSLKIKSSSAYSAFSTRVISFSTRPLFHSHPRAGKESGLNVNTFG